MRSHLISAIRARCALPASRSRRGGVAVLVALVLVVLIGFVALGTEVVALLMTSRQMQSAADTAALAAATARTQGYPTVYADEAVAVARAAGFVNGVAATTVAVNSPPISGAYSGNVAAVQVVISQVQPLLLTALFRSVPYTLTARAVGLTGEQGACVLALRPTLGSAILADNNATALLDKCGVAANSSSATAILLTGAAHVTAAWLNVVGNVSVINGSTLTISGATRTGATAVANPYAARVLPTPAGTCISGTCSTGITVAWPEGTYCSIALSNGCKVTLSTVNGTYIVKAANFSVSGATISAAAATIVLAGTGTGTNAGSVNISNVSTVNLTAPKTGPTAGMVFFQDIRALNTGTNTIANSTVTLNGAAYFPNQLLTLSSIGLTSAVCTQLIARTIHFLGNNTIRVNCAGFGTLPAGGTPGRLVE